MHPEYIEQEWARRADSRGISSSARLLGALAWFSFCIPILNVVWILSVGGKRRVSLHVVIAALALGGSIAELLARLMMVSDILIEYEYIIFGVQVQMSKLILFSTLTSLAGWCGKRRCVALERVESG